MLGNINFPEGIDWIINNKNLYDIYGEDYHPTSLRYAYDSSSSEIIRIKYPTDDVTDMSYMFNECKSLISIPQINTSNVTNMTYMFYYCSSIVEAPQLDTSKVTNMTYMYATCSRLKTVPQYDMRSVTSISQLFYGCDVLEEIPDCNCMNVKNFGSSSYSTWLYGTKKLKKIGVIDCDSVTDINYVLGREVNNNLTDLGGFRNLGKASSVSGTNGNYFMAYAPNLTYQSIMNVLNLLYDRAANGLSNLTLKLHSNHMALLSDEDKLVAVNKGWTLTT